MNYIRQLLEICQPQCIEFLLFMEFHEISFLVEFVRWPVHEAGKTHQSVEGAPLKGKTSTMAAIGVYL
jgi:hypothetical protein